MILHIERQCCVRIHITVDIGDSKYCMDDPAPLQKAILSDGGRRLSLDRDGNVLDAAKRLRSVHFNIIGQPYELLDRIVLYRRYIRWVIELSITFIIIDSNIHL